MGIKDWFSKAKDAAQDVDMDEMMDKAKEMAAEGKERAGDMVDKAKEMADKEKVGDLVDKAKDMAGDNVEKVKDAIDKAADFVDEKTGGKFSGQVDQGAETAKDAVEDFTEDE